MMAVMLVLTLLRSADAAAAVRETHLTHARGNVDVYVESGQCVIVIEGLIDRDSVKPIAEGFRQLRPSECKERIMRLNSPGGIPNIAYGVADLLRKFEFDTEIADRGLCASACTYIFLGGRKRYIGDKSRFGVHQHSRDGVCSAVLTDNEQQRIRRILAPSMPPPAIDRLIVLILATDCKGMNFLARGDLAELSIANAQQSRINKAIQNAMEVYDNQETEKLRTSASGPWVRSAGDKAITVFTRGIANISDGGKPAIWGLVNHVAEKVEEMSGERYRSYESLLEADCERQTLAVIRGFFIREEMGEGRIVWKTGRMAPVPVKARTPDEVFYKEACGRPLSR
jgi:hypothetical protein